MLRRPCAPWRAASTSTVRTLVWSGEIGHVTEVHAWTNRPSWPQGLEVIPVEAPVTATFDWDIWLGIAESRPYSPAYAPHHWRGFPDFGCGAIGDRACHILGTPTMALKLTRSPDHRQTRLGYLEDALL